MTRQWCNMPLGRYFAFTGSVLLALLFVADWYMPKLSSEPTRAGVDKSIIRIQSGHKWPEAIVFDTNLPAIPPPAIATNVPAEKSLREALAQLPQTAQDLPVTTDVAVKPERSRRPTRTRTVVRRVAISQAIEYRAGSPAGW